MKKEYLFIIFAFIFISCSITKKMKKPVIPTHVIIYSPYGVSTFTTVPIRKEKFIHDFPLSIEYEQGYLKSIYYRNFDESKIAKSIEKMKFIGHIDSVKNSNIHSELRVNIRIRYSIINSNDTSDIWINRVAQSCIKGDSLYFCPRILLKDLCKTIPESDICNYIKAGK